MGAEDNRIEYSDDELRLYWRQKSWTMPVAEITRIDICVMADPIHHGDETFHIVRGASRFWLLGHNLYSGGAVVERLQTEHPEIPCCDMAVFNLSWRLRGAPILGIRFFPIPGVGEFPLKALPRMEAVQA